MTRQYLAENIFAHLEMSSPIKELNLLKYVIIGGDAAGMSAAMQIVRNDPNMSITTLEKGGIYSYAQCGLPYVISGKIKSTDNLIARELDTFRDEYGIDAKIFHEVTSIDAENKVVKGTNLYDDQPFEYPYDKLLIATGADPLVPDWDGKELEGVKTVKTIPDVENILKEMKNKEIKHVTIVGGGYIGLEVAENFTELGLDVTIIEQGPHLAMMFDEDIASHIHEEASKHAVQLLLNESVKAFSGDSYVKTVITDKRELKTDMVIISIGVRPNTQITKDTGIHLNEKGAIIVNAFMETNVPDIYAAGDCATQFHRIKQKNDYIALGTHANKQGRIAGRNMVGNPVAFQGVVGTSIIKFHDLTLARTGLSTHEAEQENILFEVVEMETRHNASYYPGNDKIIMKLLYQRETRLLLGGQFVGAIGVDKRVDVLATALFHNMKLDELLDLDLAYAPPFNSVWDPIQQAARRS